MPTRSDQCHLLTSDRQFSTGLGQRDRLNEPNPSEGPLWGFSASPAWCLEIPGETPWPSMSRTEKSLAAITAAKGCAEPPEAEKQHPALRWGQRTL